VIIPGVNVMLFKNHQKWQTYWHFDEQYSHLGMHKNKYFIALQEKNQFCVDNLSE
jgi:hypothetical protein